MFRGEHKGRATSPSADHLRCDEFLFFGGRRLLAQVFPKRGDSRVEFAKSQEGAVPPQDLRLRTCRYVPQFVWIAHDELAGLHERPVAGMSMKAASFNVRVV